MKSLPIWYGFNILEKFYRNDPFKELDFKRASLWGFNFFRLPMDYHSWIVDGDLYKTDEEILDEVDDAVALGKKHRIHLNLNFHCAPGYTVNRAATKPFNLWKNEAQAACEFHWRLFASRYKALPKGLMSLNLVNEPHGATMPLYRRFCERMVEAIHGQRGNTFRA